MKEIKSIDREDLVKALAYIVGPGGGCHCQSGSCGGGRLS